MSETDPNSPAFAARNILRNLHDIMASRTSPQAKLNQVTQVIGEALHSEVCSIYLLRDGALELYATRGLNQAAVHVTKLALGEGLVGTIAENVEVLNLDEAMAHPDFAYKPETGEEMFHSFAGVPIVRREAAVGVLCVQHAEPRRYAEIEIEALQTTAMVLSELIAGAGLVDAALVRGVSSRDSGPQDLTGLKLVDGMAMGIAVFHRAAHHGGAYGRRRCRGRTSPRLFRLSQDARTDRRDGRAGRIRWHGRTSRRARNL